MELLRCLQLVLLLALVISSGASRQSLLSLFGVDGSIITVERDPNKKCLQNISECTSCNEGRLCRPENNELIQIATVTCLKDSNTPYCNPETGLCTSTPPESCGLNQFICPPTDGVYPDPWNCSRYYSCGDGIPTLNNCPKNNVYDHATGQCKLRRRVSDCVNFNCLNRDGQPVVYPLDDRIWGRCVNGRALILGRCEDYEKYDLIQKKCVRVCRGTGGQPGDPSDCRKYVFCAEIAPGKFEPIELSCACNQGYDEVVNRCVSGAKCLENLKNPLCESPKNNINANRDDSDKGNKETNKDNNDSEQQDKKTPELDKNDQDTSVEEFIINNSGNANIGNTVSNGNDELDGNLVNGNDNGDNRNTGNILKRNLNSALLSLLIHSSEHPTQSNNDLRLHPFIINTSGNINTGNKINNGDDKISGNVINGNNNAENENTGNINNNNSQIVSTFIINNAVDPNANNKVFKGNNNLDGNLVNGNNNKANNASGNIKNRSGNKINPLIINNSGNGNHNNDVSNGNDSVNGNLVNGNNNGENSNSGNINDSDGRPVISPFIINNSGSGNSHNNVLNGNDSVDGNLVNGNNNGGNTNSGNIRSGNENVDVNPLIINNSGSGNNGNDVSNGNDNVDGNLVNGNNNGGNTNSGNTWNKNDKSDDNSNGNSSADDENSTDLEDIAQDLPVNAFIINNAGNTNKNNSMSNGNDDVSGNLVNGNNNGNSENSGNINNIFPTKKSKRSTASEIESEPDPEYLNFLNTVIQWIIRIFWQQ